MTDEWWRPLRELNDKYFSGPADDVGWHDHVDALNRELRLSGEHQLSTFPKADLPPAWFIGDVTAMTPGEWVLVYSLNPAADSDNEFYAKREWNAERFWDYQTRWLRCWWNRTFHGSLARLASACVGKAEIVDMDELRAFAVEHLVFTELCPYASKSFALSSDAVRSLRERDVGCRVEAEITDRMLREGSPRLILVNGNRAVEHFEATYGDALLWRLREYESQVRPDKRLWHMEGTLDVGSSPTPVVGFPFLRTPRTHNATVEIEQLAQHAAGLLQ